MIKGSCSAFFACDRSCFMCSNLSSSMTSSVWRMLPNIERFGASSLTAQNSPFHFFLLSELLLLQQLPRTICQATCDICRLIVKFPKKLALKSIYQELEDYRYINPVRDDHLVWTMSKNKWHRKRERQLKHKSCLTPSQTKIPWKSELFPPDRNVSRNQKKF